MAKVIPYITTNKPDGCAIYVFGSAVRSQCACDLDILVVYDKSVVPASKVRALCQQSISALEKLIRLPVDITFLNQDEESEHQFINTAKAVLLENEIAQLIAKFG